MKILYPFFFICLLFASCNSSTSSDADDSSKTVESESAAAPPLPAFFTKVLDAHGGLSKWQKQKSLIFKKGEDTHTIDLMNRNELIKKEGTYTLGFNGDQMWIAPQRDSFPGENPRFYRNLHFYFFALPFVLADSGVKLADMGTKEIGGKTYNAIRATFGEGVGDAPEDQYILYTDPQSNQLQFINYSVTFFDKEKATQYNALVYQWQQIEGLTVPASYIGYKWENNALGDKRYEAVFESVSFSTGSPAAAIFEAPKGAWIEGQ